MMASAFCAMQNSTSRPLKVVTRTWGNCATLGRIMSRRCCAVKFCMAQKADAIIRGLRALSDFEFEFNMALMNRHLEPKLETLFVMPNEQFSYTSSTLVKQVARYGGDVSHFVPANVAAALRGAFPN